MELLFYVIILGLVVNLLANLVWKYIPRKKNIDIYITIVLIIICALFIIYDKPEKEIINDDLQTDSAITWVDNNHGYFIDKRDQQIYNLVRIGEQIWMTENLNFRSSGNNWELKQGDFFVGLDGKGKFIQDEIKCGRLYNWNDALNACPKGWHLPSIEEWKELEKTLGLNTNDLNINYNRKSSKTVAEKLLNDQNIGFNAFPCGSFFIDKKLKPDVPGGRALLYVYDNSYLWTSTPGEELRNKEAAFVIEINNKNKLISIIRTRKENGFSVRCIKD